MQMSRQKVREWIADNLYPPMWRSAGLAVGAVLTVLVAVMAVAGWHDGFHIAPFSAPSDWPTPPRPAH